ncbi:heterokaryon incompatibility protein-domain-containing protein [Nemania abortiva]|nr:heterokaryon incompatibility protein-domain-containing protein [Nemania abortiva]
MRLINTKSLELKEFLGDPTHPRFPRYAILSHTWGEEEVTFQDIQNVDVAKKKAGFAKIAKCCEIASDEGLNWAWVDTCCIDKTSSAELTEAINSMFKWYEGSTICYAYLSDVIWDDKSNAKLGFGAIECCDWRESRWFTRGWTLQELIAPFEVIIYDYGWKQLGTKRRRSQEIEKRTGIPKEVLLDPAARRENSVAERMSWAKGRQTTRIEDRTYSLLGLFDITMPLLYGEGDAAFSRLHEEILRTIEDDTMFLGGLAFSDQGVQLTGNLEGTIHKHNFLVMPDNVPTGFQAVPYPLLNTASILRNVANIASKSFQYVPGSGLGVWRRDDPMSDPFKYPRLRGDVLSMPMRIIQVLFPKSSSPRLPITKSKFYNVEIDPADEKILSDFGSSLVNSASRSFCLGLLRCAMDEQLVARYFMCLPANDELYAFPTPFYRLVSRAEVEFWPYMECHILLNRGAWRPTPYVMRLRGPADRDMAEVQSKAAFGYGWTWTMLGSDRLSGNTSLELEIDMQTTLSYRLCRDGSTEIWCLTLTFTNEDTDYFNRARAISVEIKLKCLMNPESDTSVMKVIHHRREGPVTALCRRMPVLGGDAELVISVYYGVEAERHYYIPMIRFRAFEAADD